MIKHGLFNLMPCETITTRPDTWYIFILKEVGIFGGVMDGSQFNILVPSVIIIVCMHVDVLV